MLPLLSPKLVGKILVTLKLHGLLASFLFLLQLRLDARCAFLSFFVLFDALLSLGKNLIFVFLGEGVLAFDHVLEVFTFDLSLGEVTQFANFVDFGTSHLILATSTRHQVNFEQLGY